MAMGLPSVAEPGSAFYLRSKSHSDFFRTVAGNWEGAALSVIFRSAMCRTGLDCRSLNTRKTRAQSASETGFELTAREWARLGELIMGTQLPSSPKLSRLIYWREAFVGSQVNPAYGLTFWLNQQAPERSEADMDNCRSNYKLAESRPFARG